MGNKQGHELSPEEKQKLKQDKELEKKLLKEEKERKKREKKEEKRRKKDKKKGKGGEGGDGSLVGDGEDAESIGGSSQWSEKSQGSAPGSWYHSASEPSSKRSSIYLPASAGPGYYQHDCWYSGYEDSGSEKDRSKPPSRAPSVKSVSSNLRASSLERYPLGLPKAEAIEPMHKSLDLSNAAAAKFLQERDKISAADAEVTAAIATRYDETIRSSRDHLERTSVDKASLFEKVSLAERSSISDRGAQVERTSITSSVYQSAEEGSIRGAKRKVSIEDKGSIKSSTYYSAEEGSDTGRVKRQTVVVDSSSDRASLSSLYYSADEGGSVAGSVYYSATSGSEVEDHADDEDDELFGKERPSAPGRPVAVDREGGILSQLAYVKVENDALLLRWDEGTDGGSPITGYIVERSEGEESEMWVRVNLVPIKDTEYPVANLVGGREYKFRVFAENAVGLSDPSIPSEMVSISTDQEATEPHFLRELRDQVAVAGMKVEFSVDLIGTPPPDVTWYKDGFEVYDTKRYQFLADGDRYMLLLKEAKLGDEGDIRVRATNRVGVSSSQAILTVQAPPIISLPPQYDQGLIFDTDELIRLRVPYTGKPQPECSWIYNGKLIEVDERHTMDVSEKYATLKVAGANRLDKGMYALKLTNPQGEATASFFVTVTDRPDAPTVPVITDVTGTSITLRWEQPVDDGGCRVSNYTLEYFRVGWDVWLKAASSRITWTQLTDLIVGSEYRFRVKAENAYGVSEPGPESEQILIEDAKSPSGYDPKRVGVEGLAGGSTGDFVGKSGVVIEAVSLKHQQEQYEEELIRLGMNTNTSHKASDVWPLMPSGDIEAMQVSEAQDDSTWLGFISPVLTTHRNFQFQQSSEIDVAQYQKSPLCIDVSEEPTHAKEECVKQKILDVGMGGQDTGILIQTCKPSQQQSEANPLGKALDNISAMSQWSYEQSDEEEETTSYDTMTHPHSDRSITHSPVGSQWMSRGRIAIANQFRIICGGLASMNHLGKINDDKREATPVEDVCETTPVKEVFESYTGSQKVEHVNEHNYATHGREDTHKSLVEHEEVVPAGDEMTNTAFQNKTHIPFNNLSMCRVDELSYDPQLIEKSKEFQVASRSPQASGKGSKRSNNLDDFDKTKFAKVNTDLQSFSWSSSSSDQQQDTLAEVSSWTNLERQVRSVRAKERPGMQAMVSTNPEQDIQKSPHHMFIPCDNADESFSGDPSSPEGHSSWEPKINKVIKSRIDLLENLVYRCLENEDVAMNDMGGMDDEGLGTTSPLAPLSRVSSSARVDVRKVELRDLISDLGELVTGMNKQTRTMSAEDITKFFEKTACVVGGDITSPIPFIEEKDVTELMKSNKTSRTQSLSEWTLDDQDVMMADEDFFNIMLKPYDHVTIQTSIHERIAHLDELMARCLEHEDVTLNTLGSTLSPNPPLPPNEDHERLDTSRIVLSDLIGNLGSLIKGLGQKFNAH